MRQKSFHTLNELTKFCQLRGATSASTTAAARAPASPALAVPLVQHYATIDGKQVSHPTAMMMVAMMMIISCTPLSHPPTCGPIVDGHGIGCLIEWTIGPWREDGVGGGGAV